MVTFALAIEHSVKIPDDGTLAAETVSYKLVHTNETTSSANDIGTAEFTNRIKNCGIVVADDGWPHDIVVNGYLCGKLWAPIAKIKLFSGNCQIETFT